MSALPQEETEVALAVPEQAGAESARKWILTHDDMPAGPWRAGSAAPSWDQLIAAGVHIVPPPPRGRLRDLQG